MQEDAAPHFQLL